MTFSSLRRLGLRALSPSRPGILWLLAAALCGAATLAQAAGFTFIEVPADEDGPALRGAVWSPCSTPPGRIDLAPLVLQGTRDCPVAGQGLPLVVVSHGAGGSALGHHDTAAALADAGYVVAATNHPGDNFQDVSRQGHLSAFATRPVDMKRLTDYMLGAWPQRAAGCWQGGFFWLLARRLHRAGGHRCQARLDAAPGPVPAAVHAPPVRRDSAQ
ncbi:hypothetical protein [Acidovorax kalamii]|uniref:hypothetical protein n=1 Tax=Acidovorax kalamii TaxID=2004485 RepID=UPI00338E1F02